ncbi:UNVERIFIED_CONTAM: Beta-galactosidase [Sesamum latifolium]|uniref:Beta-galactosidase n=1 Tax=Sesamum latifolium TaxID=2727402 RepID=A0AAW2XQS3_9LAMI
MNNWHSKDLPYNTGLIWYKTKFKAPAGEDPIVVDLLGLGKGIAWVNGRNIGRYWPSFLAGEDGCQSSCDFRGEYNNNKCATNCGRSSQRWYHVPRSFLHEANNTLVLMEEFGGSPLLVNFQTVTIGKACGSAYEGNTLELSCQGGGKIANITFASYGDPKGYCEAFEKGSCESPNTLSIIKKECIGHEKCSIDVSENAFGPTGCATSPKRLIVEATC